MADVGAWMPMYWADYFGDTMHLSTEEHGAYLLLLGTYWRRGKALPDDNKWLATVTKMTTKKWKMVRPKIAEFFDISDGHLYHKRVEEEIVKASGRLQSARAAGKAGGLAKSKLPTTTITEEKKEKVGAAAQPEGYSFEGMVVRLKSADFEKWRDAYAGGDESVLRAWLQQRDDWLVSPDAETGRRAKWFVTTSNWLATKADERNGHGNNAKAEASGSEGRVERVSERLKARFGQGISECPGRDDDPVLPAVQGIH